MLNFWPQLYYLCSCKDVSVIFKGLTFQFKQNVYSNISTDFCIGNFTLFGSSDNYMVCTEPHVIIFMYFFAGGSNCLKTILIYNSKHLTVVILGREVMFSESSQLIMWFQY